MTALNLVVQRNAGLAYLLTDTAAYFPDGTIHEFRSKVLVVEIPGKLSAALATSGMGGSLQRFASRLAELDVPTLDRFLAVIPAIFRDVESEMLADRVADACGDACLSVAVAHFDHRRGRAGGHVISNGNGLFPRGEYRPYTLHPTLKYLTCYSGRPFEYGTEVTDRRRWNPERDAEALFERQRADPFGPPGRQFIGVGGKAILTRVSLAGVESKLIKEWPDRVGERISESQS